MRITFDEVADMAYIYLVDPVEPGGAVRQVLAGDDRDSTVVLDYDRGGRLIGIEVFSAARQMHPDVLAVAEHQS